MLPASISRALVESILRNPFGRGWSIQGLGMLRTQISDEIRLHVWSVDHATKNVSRLHDHPWSFTSYIVAGGMENRRYRIVFPWGQPGTTEWQRVRIQTGPEYYQTPVIDTVFLEPCPVEHYKAGDVYAQAASEIHDSIPADGTVTIINRRFTDDPDHANVFFPVGEEWVSTGGARHAPDSLVAHICEKALAIWF